MTCRTALILLLGCASAAGAQQDSVRVRADSVRAIVSAPPIVQAVQSRLVPPLSPRRAFLTSLLLPGYAQAQFDRGSAGALFVAVELGALAMVKRTSDQVREARRFLLDSLPTDFIVGTDGSLQPAGRASGGFTADLIRRRRLHLEDWIAVIAFNHLLSGADAFVSAQLWDLPAAVSVFPNASGGAVVVATIRW